MTRPVPIVVRIGLALVAVWLLAAAGGPGRAQAPTADDLFNSDTTLQEIRLSVNSRDLASLRARYLENIYYAADLQWRNLRVRNVAVRSRGTGSRNATKIGIQIDVGRYTTGQRFLGLTGLVLDNLTQDPALIRERLAMATFERMGQPAPRGAFARLYINNVYQGVYAVVEPIDATFITRTLGETGGYLFEYKNRSPQYGDDLGDDLSVYKPMFEPRTHELDPDVMLFSPIRGMFREVNAPDDEVWRERVEQKLDLTQFVTHVAIEQFMAEYDGVLGVAGWSNFYLYRSRDSTRHRWLVWDRDFAFTSLDSSVLNGVNDNVFVRRALAQPDLFEHFLATLERCAALVEEDDWLANEIARHAALVAPAAYEDTRKPGSNQEFDEGLDFLREFARMRPAFVREEVARIRKGQHP